MRNNFTTYSAVASMKRKVASHINLIRRKVALIIKSLHTLESLAGNLRIFSTCAVVDERLQASCH